MTNFSSPLDPIRNPKDPAHNPLYDWIKVHGIEREKKTKEESSELPSTEGIPPRTLLLGHLAAFTQNIFSLLSSASQHDTSALITQETDLILYLQHLRNSFLVLQKEDASRDPAFVKELSESWQQCLHATSMLDWLIRRKSVHAEAVKKILSSIYHYPPHHDQTLGFYLTEAYKQEWFPVPFLEMLQALHLGYQEKKEKSILHHWIVQIGEIILSLSPQLDS